jgi:hypothetical protein
MQREDNLKSKSVLTAALLTLALSCFPRASLAVAIGQIDTFQNATTQSWTNGGVPDPINVATGGPAGSGDRFLEIQSGTFGGGSRLVAFNRNQWTGNFSSAKVSKIAVDLKNLGTSSTPLSIRLALRSGTSSSGTPGYASTTAFSLPHDNLWHHTVFLLGSANLTAINNPSPLSTFLQSVAEFRLLSAPSPSLLGDSTSGQFGVDNLQAVAEPSSIIAAVVGTGCLAGFARLARARSKMS